MQPQELASLLPKNTFMKDETIEFATEASMLVGILIVTALIVFASAAAIQIFVSPAELHEMGVWIEHHQF